MSGVRNELLKRIKCRCPQCEVEHYKVIEYTGKVPARIFCKVCSQRKSSSDISHAVEFTTSPASFPRF